MNNGEAIRVFAGLPDVPVIVKDGDTLYQIQSIQQVQGFILVNLGGAVMRSNLNSLSTSGAPVGLPDVPATMEEIETEGASMVEEPTEPEPVEPATEEPIP